MPLPCHKETLLPKNYLLLLMIFQCMVFVAKRTVLGKVLRQVVHSQLISKELDGEGSSSIEETCSFVMDLAIDKENRRAYSSTIAKARLLVSGWYRSIGE